MLLNDKLILWDEKPTYTNPDIIEMLMDQIIEVKFEDWFIQFWKIAVKYSFLVEHIDNLVLWCQSICSHNIDQVPIPHAYFFKGSTLRVKLSIVYLMKRPLFARVLFIYKKTAFISTDIGLWIRLTLTSY